MPRHLEEKLKCKICGKEYFTQPNFVKHLKSVHDLSKEDYYCEYVSTNPERQCKICGKNLSFIDFKQGFSSKCTHITLNCKICGKKYNSYRNLTKHLKNIHEINAQEYYDKYLKKEKDEELCNYCGKPSRFISLERGYTKCCSRVCTNLLEYGTEYPSQSEKVKNKTKQSNLKKYGVEYTFQSEEVKDKIKQTNLERCGYEFAS